MLNLIRTLIDKLDQIGAPGEPVYTAPKPLWDVRDTEPGYARLNDPPSRDSNAWGHKIDLLELAGLSQPANEPLYINGNPAVGKNPNRYKQHGFHFTADNCIACHACEAACSEKNGNPAHISFRSVGYVEGGTYPDYQRMNISMACNHCDDPVCLKGCPTRAYTKHLEYGAVLQDPDTCFGCGYCTWVCPYNAPQLDPLAGQVSKCNMCVDRLEEGLKPACVSACLGNALEFGVIENTPDKREQVLTQIPGFPDPETTKPNIRFQQTKSLPPDLTRTDTMPVKYAKNGDGRFHSVVDRKTGKAKSWNFKRLSSRENPLVVFTLLTQTAIGGFAALLLGGWVGLESIVGLTDSWVYWPTMLFLIALQTVALLFSTVHLGKPWRFYRGFNNLQHSALSREALGVAVFLIGLCGYTFFNAVNLWLASPVVDFFALTLGAAALVGGLAGLWYMTRIYRIKARPFWDHWQVSTAFFGSALSLGGIVLAPAFVLAGSEGSALLVGVLCATGFAVEALGLLAHSRHLNTRAGEGAASHYIQLTTFGYTYRLRNILLTMAVLAALALLFYPRAEFLFYSVLAICGLSAALIGRALFYVLVIPTTMPGAFFWKNKGFEEHARDIGLANMPQVGVLPQGH